VICHTTRRSNDAVGKLSDINTPRELYGDAFADVCAAIHVLDEKAGYADDASENEQPRLTAQRFRAAAADAAAIAARLAELAGCFETLAHAENKATPDGAP
jgi:hypothetical protein